MAQKSTQLRAQELRAVYLLLGECCELGADPLVWRRHLLTRLNREFGAVASVDIEAGFVLTPDMPPTARVDSALTIDDFTVAERDILTRCMQQMRIDQNALGARLFVESQQLGISAGTRSELVPTPEWQRCVFSTEYMTPLNWRDLMMVIRLKPHGFRSFVFSTQRGDGDFSVRSARLLELLMRELSIIPETRLAALDGRSLLRLPRRLREVAKSLAQGDTEKQIALRLNITRSTVHEYIRRLHVLFEVSSRAQLLTKLARQLHSLEVSDQLRSSDCWYFQQTSS